MPKRSSQLSGLFRAELLSLSKQTTVTLPLESIFFDLDGTLLDTAPDLAAALNEILARHGKPSLPLETIRPVIAEGSTAILAQGFTMNEPNIDFTSLKQDFLDAYARQMTNQTIFFDGMETVLHYLDTQQLPWGIVTNKPGWLAKPLLAHFKLDNRYACLVAGDTLLQRKPDPEPLYYACHLTGTTPNTSLYIGDSRYDIQAAKNAGMRVILAKYGYLPPNSEPALWQADRMIDRPLDIITVLKSGLPSPSLSHVRGKGKLESHRRD